MQPFDLIADDGAHLAAYRVPAKAPLHGVVQIAHGAAEHFPRYAHLAESLARAGYAVYGQDHRGHGASAAVHGLGSFGPGGFQSVVDDMAALTRVARAEHPGAPFVLLGHSMGSFAAQIYLLRHGANLDALVLSGTAAVDEMLGAMAAEGGALGLQRFNAAFAPGRTEFDWLSRDEAQVDAYIADPLCGFAFEEAATVSMATLAAGARLDPRLADAPKALPIYIISGERDPVTGPGQAYVRTLIDSYRAAGLLRIEHRVYPGGRHEMFNETCREDVEAELIAWLDRSLPTAQAA